MSVPEGARLLATKTQMESVVDALETINLQAAVLGSVDRTGSVSVSTALEGLLAEAASEVQYTIPDPYSTSGASIEVGRPVVIPPGTYRVSRPVTIPAGVDFTLMRGAKLVAATAMPVLLDTPPDELSHRQIIDIQGVLDCNDNAEVGFWARYFAHMDIPNMNVMNATKYGVVFGDPGATNKSYEHIVGKLSVWRGPRTAPVPTGSIGVWVRRSTDGTHHEGKIVGYETGMRVDNGGCAIYAHHVWGFWEGGFPKICFKDTAPNTRYIGCETDTPAEYGFSIDGSGTQIIGWHAYANNKSPSGVPVALQLTGELSKTPVIYVQGRVQAANGHPWKADIEHAEDVSLHGVTWDFSAGRAGVQNRYGAVRQQGTVNNEVAFAVQAPTTGIAPLLQTMSNERTGLWDATPSGTTRQRAGGHRRNFVKPAGMTYAISEANDVLLFNRADPGTATLPESDNGREFVLSNIGAGKRTITGAGGRLIDGESELVLNAGEKATVVTDGSAWWTI